MGEWALLGLFQRAILLLVVLSAGPLLVALVVGVIIGVVQAATSIQEATLSFLPKLLAVLGVMALLGPVMARLLVAFTASLYALIPQVAR
jgi:flagellar biosynthetic protein FliQ